MSLSGPHDKEFVYYCLSTDTKPVDVIGNSVLYEIDISTSSTTKYRYSGNQWVKETSGGVSGSTSYAQAIYEDGDVLYICKAALGSALDDAVWQVSMFDSGAVPNQMLWADGDSEFDNLATDLATVRSLDYL